MTGSNSTQRWRRARSVTLGWWLKSLRPGARRRWESVEQPLVGDALLEPGQAGAGAVGLADRSREVGAAIHVPPVYSLQFVLT